jgi:hypothetical protein
MRPQSEAPQIKIDESPEPRHAPPPLLVTVVKGTTELVGHIKDWTALAADAVEANVFYEPWVLLPALETVLATGDVQVVLVWRDAPGAAPQLVGFFPLERRPRSRTTPVAHLRLLLHDYLYVPVPLVHRDCGPAVMGAFFDWLDSQRWAAPLLAIDDLPVGSPFYQLLMDELEQRSWMCHVRERFSRALLAPTGDSESYLARALSSKHRADLRRRRKRLGEQGKLEIVELGADADLTPWIDEFLTLEAGGWKGDRGTALSRAEKGADFFARMAQACHAAGRLAATAIRLDGRSVAMQTTLRSGAFAYAFKIAYDEAYSKFSPGVLLVQEVIAQVAAGTSGVRALDSAAARDHSLLNDLFTERRSVESVLIAGGGLLGFLVSLLPALSFLRRLRRRS